jgi:hypothetical protein
MKKRKAEYVELIEHENDKLSRKLRKVRNKAGLDWFHKMRALNARISGTMPREAAVLCAKEFDVQDFQTSCGWFNSFKKRNSILQKKSKWEIKRNVTKCSEVLQRKCGETISGSEKKRQF